jgi:hypothetical protein
MSHPLRSVSRRDLLRAAAVGGAATGLAWVGHAEPNAPAAPVPRSDTGAEFINADTQAAIDRGLAALAQTQENDGSFADRGVGSAPGITGLAGLALMGAGHQPGRGKYGRNVSGAVDYVLRLAANGRGFLSGGHAAFAPLGSQPSAMYSHGFASLFLAEVCGMVPDPERQRKARAALEQATAFSVAAQNKEGGWRYTANPPYADVSVTVAIMMALRAARNAGVFVRKGVVRDGARYVRACQVSDGGFSYFKSQGFSAFARTAAAVVGLYSASIPEDEEVNAKAINRGLRYLQQFTPGRHIGQREIPSQHYYYGQYYAALAMWTAGGDYWRSWFPAVRDELLSRARAGGGVWSDQFHGTAYATAMSLIILQLPNNYLPILQK